tara:strand:- start:1012 stop:1260 length:249 start_codon:yes stop_codon:yes gene_type:complete
MLATIKKFFPSISIDGYENGQIVYKKFIFGHYSRYAIAPVKSRFGGVSWFVWDAEQQDNITGSPSVIRQAQSIESAIFGLVK